MDAALWVMLYLKGTPGQGVLFLVDGDVPGQVILYPLEELLFLGELEANSGL